MSKYATSLQQQVSPSRAKQRVYRLSEPLTNYDGQEYEHVVVSAVVVPYSGPETYIFGSDAEGEILNWTELPGSYRGGLDHAEALRCAGYEIQEPDPTPTQGATA